MNSQNKIIFSIIIPTLNAEKTLPLTLKSLNEQTIGEKRMEILVIDGGSTDKTVDIARGFGALILNNPQRKPEFAKHIGVLEAKGKFGVFMDADEQFIDNKSLEKRNNLFKKNKKIKNILVAGLLTPPGFSSAARYMNICGDAFSYFLYKIDGEDYINSLNNKYNFNKIGDTYEYIFKKGDILPMVDAGTHTFDLEYLKKLTNNYEELGIPEISEIMIEKTRRLGIIEDDYIYHYSQSSLFNIFKKINWKLIGNIFYTNSSSVGFSNRAKISKKLAFKKMLFVPYAASQIFPLFDCVVFSIRKKNVFFIMHYFFTEFILITSVYYYLIRIFEIKPSWGDYGK